ncbi:DUF3883 domain-containing protein [Nitrosomonas sp.]|uniref:DUF3883 domain-containing protein n=1 Tax=Nitrosomonas sp. TaxID=42353 RepID=UPI0026000FF9|nr:DUF3883 domain-containing protein [Nitrosomonas sp.]
MPKSANINTDELIAFAEIFSRKSDDKAANARGEFLTAFPLNRLKKISLDEYVIGKSATSFCSYVEPKTKAWASMQGGAANKFGIYFGKTKSDPAKQYRFTKKFGNTEKEAFDGVKSALLNLVKAGKLKNFSEIDENPLSQMFKAKILSLYFPELYLNVCSSEHLEKFALEIGIPKQKYVSEYQHLLVEKKLTNNISKDWSNPMFMTFLYTKFIDGNMITSASTIVKKPHKKAKRRVNFEDISAIRDAIGKKSEEFALNWEKNRLIGLGYPELIKKIEDRRDIPAYGYDFLSFSAPELERYIEVKSVGRDWKEASLRFYLSDNERSVSESDESGHEYYFYLVFYGKDLKPCDLLIKHAQEFYLSCEISPCAYMVRFNLEET